MSGHVTLGKRASGANRVAKLTGTRPRLNVLGPAGHLPTVLHHIFYSLYWPIRTVNYSLCYSLGKYFVLLEIHFLKRKMGLISETTKKADMWGGGGCWYHNVVKNGNSLFITGLRIAFWMHTHVDNFNFKEKYRMLHSESFVNEQFVKLLCNTFWISCHRILRHTTLCDTDPFRFESAVLNQQKLRFLFRFRHIWMCTGLKKLFLRNLMQRIAKCFPRLWTYY